MYQDGDDDDVVVDTVQDEWGSCCEVVCTEVVNFRRVGDLM